MKNLTILRLNQDNISDFAASRNNLLDSVKSGWVLFLDSDEKLSPELEQEMEEAINSNGFDAYEILRLDTFLGRELHHGETGGASFLRLAKAGWGKWERPVHEIWVGEGRVGKLSSPILHNPHKSLSVFLQKIDRYSTLEAAYRVKMGKHASLWQVFVYPLAKFKLNYFFKAGFMDGIPGLINAIFMSFHSYLTWSKLYLLCKNPLTVGS